MIKEWGIFEYLAILGALAWLPQIITWIYQKCTKPKVTLVTSPQLRLTDFDRQLMISFSCSITTEIKAALITNISLQMEHEGGGRKCFDWISMRETTQRLSDPTGGISEVYKEDTPIALKITTSSSLEKQFTCAESSTYPSILDFWGKCHRSISERLAKSRAFDKDSIIQFVGEYGQEENYNKFMSFYNTIQRLAPGEYNVIIQVKENSRPRRIEFRYRFSLSSLDVETLYRMDRPFHDYLTDSMLLAFLPSHKSEKITQHISVQLLK